MTFADLKDKKIILTGGSRGIGLSMLDKFCAIGSKVLIIGSNNPVILALTSSSNS